MAKPIFLIKLNRSVEPEQGEQVKAKVEKTLQGEYHVLVACVLDQGMAEFECFNAERLPETTIEEIKESLK
jgi:hypothetical protein